MAKTLVEKVDSPDLDVTIFKISGTLGYHENQVLTKFFNECSSRGIHKLVMDFSDLGSLGGGCAKIIRDAAAAGQVHLCISGASKTVQGFLEKKGPTSILFAADTAGALSEINSRAQVSPPTPEQAECGNTNPSDRSQDNPVNAAPATNPVCEEPDVRVEDVISGVNDVLRHATRPATPPPDPELHEWADKQASEPEPAQQSVPAATREPATMQGPAATEEPATVKAPAATREPAPAQQATPAAMQEPAIPGAPATVREAASAQTSVTVKEPERERETPQKTSNGNSQPRPSVDDRTKQEYTAKIKDLKRQLVQYKWLFSLNTDFSAIQDKGRLLDAFLLTTIAQVGVEAAAFLELSGDEFVAECWKGFETADPSALNIDRVDVDLDQWIESPQIYPLEEAPFSDAAKQRMDSWDLPHAAPFVVRKRFRGIVMLGRPIRAELDAEAWEFLNMMISQVAIAYENSCRLEKESERTLGLVQSLISMVESNTLSRGTTELVMDLTYAVAVKMHYPEEHIRDLMYGTVLRDIGMIKTSNLILRSPRELMQEEWEVIKQHPIEGAEMLDKMNFTKHTRDIVMYHHERYNGEGYPGALASSQIPLGARILSVVESYAAMLQDRPTRPALSREEALATLKENWGLRYDPEIVINFIEAIEEEIRSGERPRYKGIDLIRE
jgi:hypothetical protein